MIQGELKVSDSCVFGKEITNLLKTLNVPFSTFSSVESKIVFKDFEILFSLENTSNKKAIFLLNMSDPQLEIKAQKLFEDFSFLNVYFYRNFCEISLILRVMIKNVIDTELVDQLNLELENFNWIKLFQEREHEALLLQEEFQSIFNISNAKIQELREISLDLENSKFLIDLFNSKNI